MQLGKTDSSTRSWWKTFKDESVEKEKDPKRRGQEQKCHILLI